jgi:hypothetical protein
MSDGRASLAQGQLPLQGPLLALEPGDDLREDVLKCHGESSVSSTT